MTTAVLCNAQIIFGDHAIGRMNIDYETGDFHGHFFDRDLMRVLGDGLKDNLFAVSFYGKPGFPEEFRQQFETYNNLIRAREISAEIQALKQIQKDLKDAFHHRELDGGARAALTHPLYLDAEKKIAELQEALTILI